MTATDTCVSQQWRDSLELMRPNTGSDRIGRARIVGSGLNTELEGTSQLQLTLDVSFIHSSDPVALLCLSPQPQTNELELRSTSGLSVLGGWEERCEMQA